MKKRTPGSGAASAARQKPPAAGPRRGQPSGDARRVPPPGDARRGQPSADARQGQPPAAGRATSAPPRLRGDRQPARDERSRRAEPRHRPDLRLLLDDEESVRREPAVLTRRPGLDQLEGRNVVLEAFRAGRRVRELLLDEGAGLRGTLAEVVEQATRQDVPLTRSPRQELDRLTLTGTHQGILAWAEPRDEGTVQSTLDELQESGATPFLLLVDQVQYEQNLGAILRTAEAAGVQAVIVPKSHNALLTPVVRRISAGASEHLPLVRESPMAALAAMRRAGLRIVGADEHAPAGFDEADLTGPIALVLGGEHKGLSEPVRARCDLLVSVPMRGRTPSLNVSVAAALLLYERVRQERAQQRRRAATIAPPPFEPDPD